MPATVAVYDQKTIDELKQELIDRTMELHNRLESQELGACRLSDRVRKLETRGHEAEKGITELKKELVKVRSRLNDCEDRLSPTENACEVAIPPMHPDERPFEDAKAWAQDNRTTEQREIEQLKAENQALRVENHRLRDEVERHFDEAETIKTLRELLAE